MLLQGTDCLHQRTLEVVADTHDLSGRLHLGRQCPLGTDELVKWQSWNLDNADQLNEYLGKVPEKLNLDGKEVHIVYQQDLSVKAHTIDWDTNRVNKHLRIGQPLSYYNTANFERIFPMRQKP